MFSTATRRTYQFRPLLSLFVLAALVCSAQIINPSSTRAEEKLCFPEAAPVIRDCIEGTFLDFWRANGGLAVFGYPITEARNEVNSDTGATYLTQYFERQRFELHPENAGTPYEVLLGRLGQIYLERKLTEGFNPGDKGSPALPHYDEVTGYNIGFRSNAVNPEGDWYWEYYSRNGLEFDGRAGKSYAESLALIGRPLTAPRLRMTTETSYQVFERTIIQYQGPQFKNDPQWRMVGGRLGVWYYKYVMNADPENRLAYP